MSLTAQYGKQVQKISKKLLDLDMYDFVGTDTHHEKHLALLETMLTVKNKKKLDVLLKRNSQFLN